MTSVIYRAEWKCTACHRVVKTMAHGRVHSLAELMPTGWTVHGDSATCLDCQRGRTLPESPPVQP